MKPTDKAKMYLNWAFYYKNKAEVLEAANELNKKIVEEGITLLKNEDAILPLKHGQKVAVHPKESEGLI